MIKDRFRIALTFEVDRDMCPGFGHEAEDWVKVVNRAFEEIMLNTHYHPTLKVESVETVEVT